jgi:hypothetical protein
MHIHSKLCSKLRSSPLLLAIAFVAALAIGVPASAQKIISFDAPNAGTAQNQGTVALGINLEGTITGCVTDSSYGKHGFVGTLKGGFTDFDAPGADPLLGGTCAQAINDFGFITGYSIDSNGVYHGFVRAPDGKVSVFEAPGADTIDSNFGTYPMSINNLGAVVGFYWDANSTAHGFLRAADGKFTTLDDPAGGKGVNQGTWPYSINDFGMIVGATTYSNNVSVGLLRTADGRYHDFEFPLATYFNTAYINDFGVIAGSYSRVHDPTCGCSYDFIGYQRAPDGKLTTYQPSGSGTTTTYANDGTWTNAVNIVGATTGYFITDEAELYAFLREANGKIIAFGYPDQAAVPGSYEGSGGYAINAAGVVAGFWNDSNFANHGLLRLPN